MGYILNERLLLVPAPAEAHAGGNANEGDAQSRELLDCGDRLTWTPHSAHPIRNRETARFRPAAGHGRNGAPYMVDGRLTKEERACLIPLDAADETRMGSPGSGSPCPGGPAAGTMHASGASGDGWRSRWETRRISLRGGHGACRQARRLLQRLQGGRSVQDG